jgi:hypothetical protein
MAGLFLDPLSECEAPGEYLFFIWTREYLNWFYKGHTPLRISN